MLHVERPFLDNFTSHHTRKNYEIERSLDGTAFESLGTVRIPDAVGNTLTFGYDDHAVVPDQWYMYRIKSWDLNGQTGRVHLNLA